MKYRKLSATGDAVFGGGLNAFWIDVPEAVAQAAATRLKMQLGEWFLDTNDGTPWQTQVLGKYTGSTRDMVIKARVMGTPGAIGYSNYSSQVGALVPRAFTVKLTLDTLYGQVNLAGPI